LHFDGLLVKITFVKNIRLTLLKYLSYTVQLEMSLHHNVAIKKERKKNRAFTKLFSELELLLFRAVKSKSQMGEDPSASFQKILQQNATSPSIGGKTDATSVFNLNTNFF